MSIDHINDGVQMMKTAGWIFFACWTLLATSVQAAGRQDDDSKIRKIVMEMMKEKDKQIGGLEERIKELEALAKNQETVIAQLKTGPLAGASEKAATPAGKGTIKESVDAAEKAESPLAKLILPKLRKKEEEAKAESDAAESGPKVGGWMEMTARTKSGANTIFNLGVVELDLDKIVESKHFAASAALDWFPYGVSPNAQIGVGLVDFHMYDDAVPVRGRIFQEPGFHVQVGQFDVPFSADYQYFAAKDRITVTPPITTSRMQMSGLNPANGGFNSTGIRSYGSWNNFNYAVYWVESLYDANPSFQGGAVGGRIGYAVRNPYRLHKRAEWPILDIGLSTLVDMDRRDQTGDKVYALDMSMSYGPFRMINEFLLHDASLIRNESVQLNDEYGFHDTLVVNLEDWLSVPLKAYGRYQEWHPKYDLSITDPGYRVRALRSFSIGLNYQLNSFVQMKVEYNDYLGTHTDEPSFQKRFGIAELVATF